MSGAPKKLDVKELREIELLHKAKWSAKRIGDKYSVSKTTIRNIIQGLNGNNGPGHKPKSIMISTQPRTQLEIPVELNIKGDTVRAIFMMLTGSSHRGKINECLVEVQTILGHLDFKPRIRKEGVTE